MSGSTLQRGFTEGRTVDGDLWSVSHHYFNAFSSTMLCGISVRCVCVYR